MAVNFLDKVGALFLITKVKTLVDGYVKKENGKGLSTNDFTNAYKTKVDGSAPLASPTFTGTPSAPTAVKGTNTTQIATTAFVKTAVDEGFSKVKNFKFEKPESGALPETGEEKVIYLIPNAGSGTNVYDEYYWDSTNSKFELFGTTQADLSGYVKATDLVPITNEEIEAMFK